MKTAKKQENKVEVDLEFLKKICKKIDYLEGTIVEMSKAVQNKVVQPVIAPTVTPNPKLDYKVTMSGIQATEVNKYQTEFMVKFQDLIRNYKITEFKVDYKK